MRVLPVLLLTQHYCLAYSCGMLLRLVANDARPLGPVLT